MKPDEVVLTIELDLGDYQFKHVRLTTNYDEARLSTIRAEAMEFVQSLENVISFELGESYAVQGPQNEVRSREWEARLDDFLEKHPTWEYDALWAERVG